MIRPSGWPLQRRERTRGGLCLGGVRPRHSLRPGARAALEAKALPLVGGGEKTPPLVSGKGAAEGVFLADRADVMLGYCSGAPEVVQAVPGLVSVPLPPDLTVEPAYGMVVLNENPVTLRFAAFVMSETGQALLQ